MKTVAILVVLLVAGAVFYMYDGAQLTGLVPPPEIPETITPPNATFIGNEQSNPFVM